jgi:hypothetical protein
LRSWKIVEGVKGHTRRSSHGDSHIKGRLSLFVPYPTPENSPTVSYPHETSIKIVWEKQFQLQDELELARPEARKEPLRAQMVAEGDQAEGIYTSEVGFHFFYHYPSLRIFHPYLTPIEFQERSNGGPVQNNLRV